MTTYLEGMKKQDDLRKRLSKILVSDPQPLVQIAHEMGVAPQTFNMFLRGKDTPKHYIYLKILNYVEYKEGELGLV